MYVGYDYSTRNFYWYKEVHYLYGNRVNIHLCLISKRGTSYRSFYASRVKHTHTQIYVYKTLYIPYNNVSLCFVISRYKDFEKYFLATLQLKWSLIRFYSGYSMSHTFRYTTLTCSLNGWQVRSIGDYLHTQNQTNTRDEKPAFRGIRTFVPNSQVTSSPRLRSQDY